MINPLADPYIVLNKVYFGGKFLKQALSDTQMEPNGRARTVKICYGVLEKDVYLGYIIGANTQKPPRGGVKLILKIALYMLEFMGKHDYMVVDYAVTLAKNAGKEGAAGFINAFLRSYNIPPTPESADLRLSLEASAPLWMAKRIRRSYKSEAADILSAPSKGVCVRFERGKEEYLAAEHIDTPFENVHIFPNFTRDAAFFEGRYTFQSVGSVAICDAVEPCANFLDACAAPGGKSVLISKKCASVTACELHPHRTELIESYIRRMGVKNVTARTADSTIFMAEYDGVFDGVLCDAPCSGTGVINENPDIKLFRKESDIAELTALQIKILDNCSRYVKTGGRLYYSTCSVLPEENDSVAYNFLQRHPEFELAEPVSPLAHRTTKFGLQFLPHISLGAGFFIAEFVKKQVEARRHFITDPPSKV